MEGLATGRMVATSAGNNFTELAIRASSSRFTIPVCTVSVDTVRIRTNARFCNSGFRISGPRHSCSSSRSRLVLCCKEDGNSHESSSEGTESSIPWRRGEEETVGHHGSKGSDGAEVNRLRQESSELRASLAELSQSLASISAALAEVSRAVQLVANAVDCGPSENGVLGFAASEPLLTGEFADVPPEISVKEEPLTSLPSISSPKESEIQGIQDPVQTQLMEQNMMAHKVAYKIQQAFFQARIEGLGKPFQLAAEDFVTTCLEAHAMGIGLKELQLQLILLEGSLTGAFAIRNQRYSDDPVMSEESRVRSSWVRLVFTTLAEVKERRSRVEYVAGDVGKEREQPDPSDAFVKELVTLAFEKGYDLERLKLEQNVSGPVTSGAIKTMRQSAYLVLLTLQKTTSDAL